MREGTFLSPAFSSPYECRAEVIIMHAPGTSDTCTTHRGVHCQSSPSALLTSFLRSSHPLGTFPRGLVKRGLLRIPSTGRHLILALGLCIAESQASKPAPTRSPVT